MTDNQAAKVARWVGEMVHFSFAGLSMADWSDSDQPATFSDTVMERAYEACEPLSPSALGALVVLAWGQNTFEHNNILSHLTGGGSSEQFEHAVAALILLWYEKAAESGS